MKKLFKNFLLVSLVFCLLFSFGFAKTKKSHKVAWMGVYTQTLDDDLVKAFELPVDYGAIINKVVDDSPADKAGLMEDDIIISFSDKKVRTSEDLVDFVRDQNPGDKIKLIIIDEDGNKKDVEIELGRRKSLLKEFAWSGIDDDDDDKLRYFFFSDDAYPYIGVTLSELSDQLGEFFGVQDGDGVLISEVEEDSPAEKAGLKAGDVIVAVDDEEVEDAGDVQEIIRDKEVGETAEIAVLRDRKKELIKVEVGEKEGGGYYGNTWNLHIPDLPKIDIYKPKMRGLYQSLDQLDLDDLDIDFDTDEFQNEMRELKKELKKMKKELKEIQEKLD